MPENEFKPVKARRFARTFTQPSETNQGDGHHVDANKLLAQYRKNGTLPNVHVHRPLYGDFTGPQDLHRQIEAAGAAFDRFAELPASVRTLADNSPVRFLEMFDNPEERAMLQEAGLGILDEPNENQDPDTTPNDTQPSASEEKGEASASTFSSDGSEGGA